MKKFVMLLVTAAVCSLGACEKDSAMQDEIPAGSPRTEVPVALRGAWMFGHFSMTEYWSQNPADYLGNALEYAIAFRFEPDGRYTQYFTSSSVLGGKATYQQSVTKGTVEVDESEGTIKTHAVKAHYKRMRGGQVLEERDLASNELSSATTYQYTTGTETSGAKALYLTLNGTSNPLPFLKQ